MRNLIMSSVDKNVWIIYCYHILLVGVSISVTFLGSNLLTIINFVNAYTILMPEIYLRTHTQARTRAHAPLPPPHTHTKYSQGC